MFLSYKLLIKNLREAVTAQLTKYSVKRNAQNSEMCRMSHTWSDEAVKSSQFGTHLGHSQAVLIFYSPSVTLNSESGLQNLIIAMVDQEYLNNRSSCFLVV